MAKGNTSSTDDNSADNDSLSATPSTGGVRGIARSASRSKPYDANNVSTLSRLRTNNGVATSTGPFFDFSISR